MSRRLISHAQIMAARDQPPGSRSPAGWTRETLAGWGVPWPAPSFWIAKLVAGGVPYVEPTVAEIRVSPLRAMIWTPPHNDALEAQEVA